jgi:Mg-chelatase subunit ChlD
MNVYILLDRSGSMQTLWNEAIGSINAYVSKLKKSDKVHLAVFDNVSHDVIRNVKSSEWIPVSDQEVQPRGGTPLYDSCGKIMAQAELDNAKKTILVVMTDGWENASQEYTKEAIQAKVKSFEDKKWEVIFLGANFDSVESVSGSIGVASSKTLNYAQGNMMRGMEILAASSALYSTSGVSMEFSNEVKTSLGNVK